MATTVTVKLDTSEIKALVKQLDAGQAATAISRGLNDSIKLGRTQATREIRDRYNLPLFEIRRKNWMRLEAARRGDLEAKLFASLRSVPLSSFKGVSGDLQSLKRTRQKGGGIRTEVVRKKQKFQNIKRSRPRKKVALSIVKNKKITLDHAFLTRVSAGGSGAFHIGVFNRSYNSKGYAGGSFRRRSGKRVNTTFPEPDLSIAQLYSFTVHKAMSNRMTEKGVIRKMEDAVPRRTEYWLKRTLGKVD